MEGVDVTIPITAQGRLSSVSQFEDIVVRANPDGSIIRLRDVANISLEAQSYNTESGINGGNAAVLDIYMLPGANAVEVAGAVRATMDEISRNFPEGITYNVPFDMTTYISESIHEVYSTLFEALILVIIVVYLSLQSWRATLIPVVAVPISLVGTFGVMLAFGFSLNLMTLLGLILAIGTVVDDAIVVVENVERIMNEEHLSPYEATKKAMSGLGGALIAMSLVLCAVFVPVSFLSGITGQLYRQFSITIAVSVIISTVVALTLSPVMCSLFLAARECREKEQAFPLYRPLSGQREQILRPDDRTGVRAFSAYVCGFRNPACRYLGDEPAGSPEFYVPRGSGLLYRGIGAARGRHDRADARGHGPRRALPEEGPRRRVCAQRDGVEPRVGTNQARSQLTVILKPWDERETEDIGEVMQRVRDELSRYPESRVYLSIRRR